MIVRWVRQEDAEGCALAVLAMLTGETYADVKAAVDGVEGPRDWEEHGCTHHTIDRHLATRGWFWQRRYDWPDVPLEPFAEVHHAQVLQPSGNQHFVVVLGRGAVLDPLRFGLHRLSDWPKVQQLVGLIPPEAL